MSTVMYWTGNTFIMLLCHCNPGVTSGSDPLSEPTGRNCTGCRVHHGMCSGWPENQTRPGWKYV